MKDAIYRISLDIHEHGSQAVLKAKKTDTGRMLHITLREGGTPYIIEADCYAVFKATKPDGSILYNACTIERNEIIYEFTEQTCTAVGRCRCEIALYGLDDKLITSPRFALLVDGTIYPEGSVESTDEFSALTHLISDTLKATGSANEASDAANDAAANANEATASANASASNANEAAHTANVATQNANTATKTANQAASAATQAAQSAIVSAGNADGSADRANAATESANNATINAKDAAKNANEAAIKAAHTAKSLMVIGGAEGTAIYLSDAADQVIVSGKIFGKTTQDGTPTPDAPVELMSVGDGVSIGVTVSGKNLVNAIVNGTQSAAYAGALYCKLDVLEPNTEYTVSFVGADGNKIYANENLFEFKEFLCDGKRQYVTLKTQHNISKDRTDQYTEDRWIIFKNYASNTVVPNFKDVQIERGSTPTAYEPHKAQTFSVSTPNGLLGVPVPSGGNYTDANGQQWVADYRDYAQGVDVCSCVHTFFTGNEAWYVQTSGSEYTAFWTDVSALGIAKYIGNTLCSHARYVWDANTAKAIGCFARNNYVMLSVPNSIATNTDELKSFLAAQYNAGTPVEVLYQREEPLEAPLSEEEIAAYNALHTYRGNTTVSNDAGAYMELEYVMDAKKYIDSLVAGNLHPATVE